jgi:hypothetical protein
MRSAYELPCRIILVSVAMYLWCKHALDCQSAVTTRGSPRRVTGEEQEGAGLVVLDRRQNRRAVFHRVQDVCVHHAAPSSFRKTAIESLSRVHNRARVFFIFAKKPGKNPRASQVCFV